MSIFVKSKADPMEKKFTHEELKVSKGKPPEVDPVPWIQRLLHLPWVFLVKKYHPVKK